MSLVAEVQFGREVCGELEIAESREWLVTNGLGGYASGTVAGTTTRRYHGLLVAALQPPVKRTMLVSGLDETVRYLGSNVSFGNQSMDERIYFAQRLSSDRKLSSRGLEACLALRARGRSVGKAHLDETG